MVHAGGEFGVLHFSGDVEFEQKISYIGDWG